jgi:hypothetical protein
MDILSLALISLIIFIIVGLIMARKERYGYDDVCRVRNLYYNGPNPGYNPNYGYRPGSQTDFLAC